MWNLNVPSCVGRDAQRRRRFVQASILGRETPRIIRRWWDGRRGREVEIKIWKNLPPSSPNKTKQNKKKQECWRGKQTIYRVLACTLFFSVTRQASRRKPRNLCFKHHARLRAPEESRIHFESILNLFTISSEPSPWTLSQWGDVATKTGREQHLAGWGRLSAIMTKWRWWASKCSGEFQ